MNPEFIKVLLPIIGSFFLSVLTTWGLIRLERVKKSQAPTKIHFKPLAVCELEHEQLQKDNAENKGSIKDLYEKFNKINLQIELNIQQTESGSQQILKISQAFDKHENIMNGFQKTIEAHSKKWQGWDSNTGTKLGTLVALMGTIQEDQQKIVKLIEDKETRRIK